MVTSGIGLGSLARSRPLGRSAPLDVHRARTREHRLGPTPLGARASLDFAAERCAEKRERGRGRGVQERQTRMVAGLDENAGADGVNRVDGGPGPHDIRRCPLPEDDRRRGGVAPRAPACRSWRFDRPADPTTTASVSS